DEDREEQGPDEGHDARVDARRVRPVHGAIVREVKKRPAPPTGESRRRRSKRVAEPLAISSTSPSDFPPWRLTPPLRTALRWCFGLVSLRARRRRESMGARRGVQGRSHTKSPHFADFQ